MGTKIEEADIIWSVTTLFLISFQQCHTGFFWGYLKKNWVGTKGRWARSLKHLCFLMQGRSISQGIRLKRLLSGKKISWLKFPFTFVPVAFCCLLSSMQPQGSRCPFPADISVPTVVSCTPSTELPFSFHNLGSGSKRASSFLQTLTDLPLALHLNSSQGKAGEGKGGRGNRVNVKGEQREHTVATNVQEKEGWATTQRRMPQTFQWNIYWVGVGCPFPCHCIVVVDKLRDSHIIYLIQSQCTSQMSNRMPVFGVSYRKQIPM